MRIVVFLVWSSEMRLLTQFFLILITIFGLIACSRPDQKLVGSWTTHKGECRSEGEMVIEVYDKVSHVDFMCFAKTCARIKGKIDQAGYLRFSLSRGQYLEGQINNGSARGSWGLELEKGYCQGSFRANPINRP
jgi:hypothetical protein